MLSQQTLANLTPEQKDALLLQLLQMVNSSGSSAEISVSDTAEVPVDLSTNSVDISEDLSDTDGSVSDDAGTSDGNDDSDSDGSVHVSGILSPAGQPIEMIDTIDDAFQDAFDNFIASHPNGLPSPKECRGEIMKLMKDECELHNSILPKK